MNQLTDRERALAVAMVGWLLTHLSASEDHQRMASVFGFVLAFCFKAHLEDHLSEDEIELLWQGAAQAVRTEDWLLMLGQDWPGHASAGDEIRGSDYTACSGEAFTLDKGAGKELEPWQI
jgi:hypothetical protein